MTLAAYSERIGSLKTLLARGSPFHRTYSLDESIALIATYLGESESQHFVAEAWARLARLEVTVRPIAFDRARLKYRSRFVDWSIRRSRFARVIWSDAVITDQRQLEKMLDVTIDIYSEAAFIPVRRHSIFLRAPKTFISHNLEIIKEKLLLKLFVLGEDFAVDAPGSLSKVFRTTTAMFKAVLPLQFSVLRSVRLNQDHVAAFKADGPRGVYRCLKCHEGFSLALRYWANHLTNLRAAIIFAYVATVAPSALETRDFFAARQAFEATNDAQFKIASQIYHSVRVSPAELMTEIEARISDLSPEEQITIRKALAPL